MLFLDFFSGNVFLPVISKKIFFFGCFKAAAKEATGQATQLIAAARSAGPSNRNQASQQQLSDQCKVSSMILLTGTMHLF